MYYILWYINEYELVVLTKVQHLAFENFLVNLWASFYDVLLFHKKLMQIAKFLGQILTCGPRPTSFLCSCNPDAEVETD